MEHSEKCYLKEGKDRCWRCDLVSKDPRYAALLSVKTDSTFAQNVPELCVHLGDVVSRVECGKCPRGKVQLKVFTCSIYGTCTLGTRAEGVAGCCRGCSNYQARQADDA